MLNFFGGQNVRGQNFLLYVAKKSGGGDLVPKLSVAKMSGYPPHISPLSLLSNLTLPPPLLSTTLSVTLHSICIL